MPASVTLPSTVQVPTGNGTCLPSVVKVAGEGSAPAGNWADAVATRTSGSAAADGARAPLGAIDAGVATSGITGTGRGHSQASSLPRNTALWVSDCQKVMTPPR